MRTTIKFNNGNGRVDFNHKIYTTCSIHIQNIKYLYSHKALSRNIISRGATFLVPGDDNIYGHNKYFLWSLGL